MKEEKFNRTVPVKTILVAPLDWGLGHATRCIPIIRALLKQQFIVLLAAEDPIARLMQKEFPAITILPLKGYRITYGRTKSSFNWHLLLQFPKILIAIKYENEWLAKMVTLHKIDTVISDNRFGLYHPSVPCYFITHQLHVETGNRLLNKLAQHINYKYINRFTECWVPDDQRNLGGILSRPLQLPGVAVKYIGLLSRFSYAHQPELYDLLFLISGPEPQRSIFEKLILTCITNRSLKIAIVRGLPMAEEPLKIKNVQVFNHLPAAELSELIQQSSMVVCRAGYSTLMDLCALEKRAIIVPTPGQTEQEYLADFLGQRCLFLSVAQHRFDLDAMLDRARIFPWRIITDAEGGGLTTAIMELCQRRQPEKQ